MSHVQTVMPLKLAAIATIVLSTGLCWSELAIAMPLKPGAYSWASNYIQIAQKGSRLCYQGFSARGTLVSSLAPDSKKSGFYRLHGAKDLFIRQDSPTQISYGSLDNLLPYTVNGEFGTQLTPEMQQCLNSSKPFSKQQMSTR